MSSEPLEANLHDATDEEWLRSHAYLKQMLLVEDWPRDELRFIWEPSLDPADLIDPGEVEEAPGG